MDKSEFKSLFLNYLQQQGKTIEKANPKSLYRALGYALRETIMGNWVATQEAYEEKGIKQMYYFSAEFLMGRALTNNLINLGFEKMVEEVCADFGIDFNELEDSEPDAGLGNGGLGRLAACFLDSLATLNLPGHGYGIRYKYGMFRQAIEGGVQKEYPDNWLEYPDIWSVPSRSQSKEVSFGGWVDTIASTQPAGETHFIWHPAQVVRAIPFDTPITGFGTDNVNTLRLWQAESIKGFEFSLFNEMRYLQSVQDMNQSEDLSRVLYPNDSEEAGKALRLKQQYFFVSASLQDLLCKYKATGKPLMDFPNFHAIQLNDTHPTVGIAELMRLLIDEEELNWEDSWDIVTRTFAYTNHTILAEALEKWDIELFNKILPRPFQLITEINRRFLMELESKFPVDAGLKDRLSIIGHGQVRMAWLAIVASFSVNGVAELHTQILKREALKEWNSLYPTKFNNKTNGVTQRRWLRQSNPELAEFLTEKVGETWTTDMSALANLESLAGSEVDLKKLAAIKHDNKKKMAEYLESHAGVKLNLNSIFDVQIKRMHEYKRQFMNILHVLYLYFELKENQNYLKRSVTFFFGGKSASGYRRAKSIIHLINNVGTLINQDPEAREKLQVVFLENYGVSIAQKMIPATDISEQISTAGKEASGTSNMKFMMNGALTLGTMDGANVEIVEEVGMEHAFIFGLSAQEVEELNAKRQYNPISMLEENPKLKKVVDTLLDPKLEQGEHRVFAELYDSLLYGVEGNPADEYYLLKDFESYRLAHEKARERYEDEMSWQKSALINIARSGRFSSDRTINDYAKEIWKINPLVV